MASVHQKHPPPKVAVSTFLVPSVLFSASEDGAGASGAGKFSICVTGVWQPISIVSKKHDAMISECATVDVRVIE